MCQAGMTTNNEVTSESCSFACRPEHFTKSIVAKLAALELPFAHKAVDWIMDEDWSTKKSVPSTLGQFIRRAELEANCVGASSG